MLYNSLFARIQSNACSSTFSAVSESVKNFQGNKMASRRNSGKSAAGGSAVSSYDPSDMGSVTIIVIGDFAKRDKIPKNSDPAAQIQMSGIYASIKNSHPHAKTAVIAFIINHTGKTPKIKRVFIIGYDRGCVNDLPADNFASVLCYKDSYLPLGRRFAVGCGYSPAVCFIGDSFGCAHIDHWFNCKHHSGYHENP